METSTRIILSLPMFLGLAAAWGTLCALIGWLIAERRSPRRYILVEDTGAWTIAKLHSVDNRDDDAPPDLPAGATAAR